MSAPREIENLVERFGEHRAEYSRVAYKEAQVCAEFIMPMFEALGWDVYNRRGYAEAYKEVVHQHALRTASGVEAPDYCFRVGGTPKFFLEAKKPSVNISTDISPAYQLRRYAWTARLSLSVLTDFEELSVYDTRLKPGMADKASVARVRYIPFEQYPERWDEIASVFSREAILKGSFDRYADTSTGKRGTTSVDSEFLAEIEAWRDELARNFALRNKDLSVRELNFAVQRTIDRILFLRICEDRGIENYGRLQALLNGGNVHPRLYEIFEQADQRYNSGLFHFHKERERDIPDELTPGLSLDDKVLKGILGRLYYPESPYEFSILPADVLGQVYEQFLGKVIRLTAGHQAKVEDKPEVKKAGGVYYTPTYIVEYIVKNTVGKLLEGCRSPKDAAKLKILDPACGSGSFLIVVYQTLLDWHLDWYSKNGPEELARKASPPMYQAQHLDPDGAPRWLLTTSEKKRILLNGIYGVDIDSQAVEVTKLSLMLKVLEGESEETINTQMKLFHERALPDLSSNIKCGNSLIGPDFYDGRQLGMLDQEEMYRVNVFDWKRAYPAIMEAGGFDAVIGNPPYIRIQTLKEWAPLEVEHYKRAFKAASKGNYDIYVCFVEKGLSLLNPGGKLGFILPHKFFNSRYGQPLRKLIGDGRHLSDIIHFGEEQVFSGATTYTCLLFLTSQTNEQFNIIAVNDLYGWRMSGNTEQHTLPYLDSTRQDWTFSIASHSAFLKRIMEDTPKLSDLGKVFVGTQTSADDVFVLEKTSAVNGILTGWSKSLGHDASVEEEWTVPFLRGKDIRRYSVHSSACRLICPYDIADGSSILITSDRFRRDAPLAYGYLAKNLQILDKREKGRFRGESFYQFGYPKSMHLFQRQKLIVPDYGYEASFALDSDGHFFKTGYGIIPVSGIQSNERLLLWLSQLNSRLHFWILQGIGTKLRGGWIRFWTSFIGQLPLLDCNDRLIEDAKMNRLIELARDRSLISQSLGGARTPDESRVLADQARAIESQIDLLVYELYGLTDKEIALVEERTSNTVKG